MTGILDTRQVAADQLLFYDDFETNPGALIGRTPLVGAAWVATGAGAGAAVVGSGYVSSPGGNTYCFAAMAQTPHSYGGVFEVTSGTPSATLACSLTQGSLTDMIHPTVGSTHPTGLFWKTGLGTSLQVANADYGDPWAALSINTRYVVSVAIEAPYLDISLRTMAGVPLGGGRLYEPNMASIIGPNLFFQLNSSANKWHEVWAYARPAGTSKRFGTFTAGIENTTIGKGIARAARFSSAHIGRGGPAGPVLSVRHDSTDVQAPLFIGVATNGLLKIIAETAGYQAQLWLQNGAGGIAKMLIDGGYVTQFVSNSAVWLSKGWTQQDEPFFSTGIRINGPTGPRLLSGVGTPEAVVTGIVGDVWLRTDGAATTTLYIKTSGTGNTGWTAK